MQLSLFTKLRELEKIGHIKVESDPNRHYFGGEGTYTFNGKPCEIISDFTGQSPDGSSARFKDPHDILWCPSEKTIIAAAPAAYEPFKPLSTPLKIKRGS